MPTPIVLEAGASRATDRLAVGVGLGVLVATLVGMAVGVAVAGTVVAVDVC